VKEDQSTRDLVAQAGSAAPAVADIPAQQQP
jgi:peptide/nickel transport system ATP-binding protein